MRPVTLLSLFLCSFAFAQSPTPAPVSGLGPFFDSTNFAWELKGSPDTRTDCCYGYTEAQTGIITFAPPPPGYRVRITRLRGDFIAWIKSLPGDPPTPPESTAGVLLGYQNSNPQGSIGCDWCATSTPLYIQDSVTEKQPRTRDAYDYDHLNFVLESDNQLHIVVAMWLNTTGKAIHMEPTVVFDWDYVPAPQAPKPRVKSSGPRRPR